MTLNRHDRCDAPKCGAAAYVRAMFHNGILDFCAHHAFAFRDKLAGALDVLDETHRLSEGESKRQAEGVS